MQQITIASRAITIVWPQSIVTRMCSGEDVWALGVRGGELQVGSVGEVEDGGAEW